MQAPNSPLLAPAVPVVVPVFQELKAVTPKRPNAQWSYEEAFKRNRGLITAEEQEKLRNSRVAIAGMGGVGGVHAITLARMGVGNFTIADPDIFEVANFNRQYGASLRHVGRNKAEVMAELILDINPDIVVDVIPEAIHEGNVSRFLARAHLFVDGLDAFAVAARRDVYSAAARGGLFSIGVGPVGFSAVWVTFSPTGMSFDRYFDINDSMSERDLFISYILGMAPASTQRSYVDISYVDLQAKQGPSVSSACQLASGVLAAEAAKILLRRGKIWTCPWFQQFDPFVGKLVRRRLRFGNRGPLQRLKRAILGRRLNRA